MSVVKSCLPYYETSAHIQWLLYHFSSLAYIKPLLISEQLPNRIIRYLSRLTSIQADNIIPITAQVRTVAFLSTDPDGNTVNVLLDNWDITLRIIKFLMRSNYRHLCKELFWSLGNIIRHNSPEIKSKLATKADDLRSVISFVPVLWVLFSFFVCNVPINYNWFLFIKYLLFFCITEWDNFYFISY